MDEKLCLTEGRIEIWIKAVWEQSTEKNIWPEYSNNFVTKILINHILITFIKSRTITTSLQHTINKRTSGHCLGTITAENLSYSACQMQYLSLHPSTVSFSHSIKQPNIKEIIAYIINIFCRDKTKCIYSLTKTFQSTHKSSESNVNICFAA